MKIMVWKRPAGESNAPGQVALGYLAEGIQVCGDRVTLSDPLHFRSELIHQANVHIVYNPQFNNSDRILELAAHHGKRTIVVESGFVQARAGNRLNPLHGYWLAGYGTGVKGELDFKNKRSPSDRWQELGQSLRDWRPSDPGTDRHILIAMQLEGDPSLKGISPSASARRTVEVLRRHTNRIIVIRFSPYSKNHESFEGCLHSFGDRPIEEDLRGAWALCTYSSNSVVDALVAGVPVFADGPSIARDLAINDFSRIEDPIYPDREQWARDLAYAQWTGEEMRTGLSWIHLREEDYS